MTSATTILLVEDDKLNIRLVSEICRAAGYVVRVAEDGQAALDDMEVERPDLILLDIMLPKVDGYEVLQHVRGNPATADIPVIMITAIQDSEARNKGIELGADDFLSKPFKLFELQKRVKSALQLRAFRRQLSRDLTPPAGRPRPKALLDEASTVDQTVAALQLSGGKPQVLSVEFAGKGPADVIEAVLDAARRRVPGGKSNVFARAGRRHSVVVSADPKTAEALVRDLHAEAVRVRRDFGATEPTLHWGVGPDRETAVRLCTEARDARREPDVDV